jgi:predicted acyl esterase
MRGLWALVLIVLTGASLAGCLGGDGLDNQEGLPQVVPPAELFSDFRLLELEFTASTGTTIASHVYLPEGAEDDAEFGTIVNFSPYYGNLYGIDTDGRLDAVVDGRIALNQSSTGLFLAHGFAYVAAAVPGTGKSGGCFEIGGHAEQRVMAEFIDWVAEQSWSNGRIGMHGGSYDGTTQWMAAVEAPESLVTIVPWVAIADMYEYMYQDGAPYAWWGPLFVPYYLLEVGWGLNPYGMFGNPNPEPDLLFERACPQALDQFTETGQAYGMGTYNEFWQERNYRDRLGDIQASVFLIHGLQDWNVKPLHLDVWDDIPTEKFAWLQQMGHNVPFRNTINEGWDRADYNATLLAWYDHYLNEADNGLWDALPPVWIQDSTGHWREEQQWPPEAARPTTYQLGDGRLTQDEVPSGDTMIATLPSWSGTLNPRSTLAPLDLQDAFQASYQTDTLEAPMRIAGTPWVDLNVTVDRPGYAHLVAMLYKQDADGSWEFIDMGGRGLPQREGRDRDDPVVPFETMQVPIRLNPIDTYLEPGSRLFLFVSADEPGWFHHNGNTPTVWIENGSTLALPLLPDGHPRGVANDEVAHTNTFYQADNKEY